MSESPSSSSPPLNGNGTKVSPPTSPMMRLKEQKLISKQIEKQLKSEKKIMDNELKLLLLGTGDSGKSTVVKQMKILHMKGYTEEERKSHLPFIYRNIIEIFYSLIHGCSVLKLEISPSLNEITQNITQWHEERQYNTIETSVFADLERLSKDDAIIKALQNSGSQFQLHSSSDYFLQSLNRISDKNFIPTDQDILYTRLSTVAVTETRFSVRGINFRMIDVGGQRGHRDKWIHHFSDVTAILFIVSLSEYDQVLEEDSTTNRMKESMKVFTDIINQRWFTEVPIILFLNKKDLFLEKVKRKNISCCFPDYTGSQDYDDSLQFIKKKFLSCNKTPKNIYTHVTTATDTNNISAVFEAVKDILTRQTMEEGADDFSCKVDGCNGNGKCTDVVGCICEGNYGGQDCDLEIYKFPNPSFNLDQPSVNIYGSQDITAGISIPFIREIDETNGKVENMYNLKDGVKWNSKNLTDDNRTLYTYSRLISSQLTTTLNVEIEYFNRSTPISFAGQTFNIYPYHTKVRLEIDTYKFTSDNHYLQVVFSTSLVTNASDFCSDHSVGGKDNDLQNVKLTIRNRSLNVRFQKLAVIDGVNKQNIENVLLNITDIDPSLESKSEKEIKSLIGINIPKFSTKSIIDPDFGILENSYDTGEEYKCSQKTSYRMSTGLKISISLGAVAVFVAIVGVVIAKVRRDNAIKKKQSMRKLEEETNDNL
eukprot:gene2066-2550_t